MKLAYPTLRALRFVGLALCVPACVTTFVLWPLVGLCVVGAVVLVCWCMFCWIMAS